MSFEIQPLPACPVCGSTERIRLFPISGSAVFECRSCRLKYLDPCLSPKAMSEAYESNDSLTAIHDFHENYYAYGDLNKPSKTRTDFCRALDLLNQGQSLTQTENRHLLDVGFGNGFFLALAKNRGWAVDGIDTSRHNAELCQKKFNLRLRTGDFERDIPNQPIYDCVSFWDVIEHLPDPHRFLSKTSSILKPGGFLLIAVPHDYGFLQFLASLLYRISLKKLSFALNTIYLLEHVAYYHLSPLTRLAESHSFRAVTHFYSSTDLDKYRLQPLQKGMARVVLQCGKILGMENRLIALYQKS